MSTLTATIQLRADTAANWQAANPTLKVFELGIETDSYTTSGTTRLYKCKLGDGATAWNSLGYANLGQFFAGGGGGGSTAWEDITGKPTTISGYGITDGLRCLGKITTDSSSVTGTTSPTLTNYVRIPAGSVTPGHIIEMMSMLNKSGDLGAATHRLYINTSASLSGATQVAQTTTNAASDTSVLGRIGIIKSTTSTVFPNTGVSQQTRDQLNNSAPSSVNIDWTVDQYLIDGSNLGNAGDTMKNQGIYCFSH